MTPNLAGILPSLNTSSDTALYFAASLHGWSSFRKDDISVDLSKYAYSLWTFF